MDVVSYPEADQELEGAALWYEQRQPGLGSDFVDEFERTFEAIHLVYQGRTFRYPLLDQGDLQGNSQTRTGNAPRI